MKTEHLCALGALLLCTSQIVSANESGLENRPENLTCIAHERPPSISPVKLHEVVPDLRKMKAVDMKPVPGDPDKFVVAKNGGQIDLYQRDTAEDPLAPFQKIGEFLDISENVVQTWNDVYAIEMGFLGIALHPDFQNNGYAYVYYSAFGSEPDSTYEARLSRFTSTDGGLTLDPDSEETILKIDHSLGNNHWGGAMMFDADGLFYLTLGDATDKLASQDPYSLLGKVLRLDLDSNFPYAIPSGNPFAVDGGRPEVYALGFRNPWRASIDHESGELWVGDVGHTRWEELNRVEMGGNYGWPYREGNHCSLIYENCEVEDALPPTFEYDHETGFAVLGGFIYRGKALPELEGVYIYADAVTGEVRALNYDSEGNPVSELLLTSSEDLFSLAQDAEGEIYAIGRTNVSMLVPNTDEPDNDFPKLLSETGCVDPADPTMPAEGLIPYVVNAPLWSDNASKGRWFALPDWKSEDSKITVGDEDDWEFPEGSVLVKSFSIDDALVETRLFILHDDGNWGGYSYEWREDQSDAELLGTSKTIDLANQQWTFPSRSECMQCHTEAGGFSLGLETAQLNGIHTYPTTDKTANQLATLAHIGVLDDERAHSPDDLAVLLTPDDPDGDDLEGQVRAYLHGNCSMCHQPGGLGRGGMDFRYSVSLADTGIINADPTQGNLGIDNAKIIKPGVPSESILLQRLRTTSSDRMPPLGTSIVDTTGTQLIENWILSLATAPELQAAEEAPAQPVQTTTTEPTPEPNEETNEAAPTTQTATQPAEPIGTLKVGGMSWDWLFLGLPLLAIRRSKVRNYQAFQATG